ncbi:MAG: hypothetical protein JSV62_07185 [Promethearchaeota archaeon]|nr:MAG: hypothetical protein JSV62_07185 [Candidatus Lokiarchaeota archaeon]
MNKPKLSKYEELIHHVNRIDEYLQFEEVENPSPSILQVRHNLGYDVSSELGADYSNVYEDLFEDALSYMIEHKNIIVERDLFGVLRIIKLNVLAGKLYTFLESKWETEQSPRFIFIYEEFSAEEYISKYHFEALVKWLQESNLVDVFYDNNHMIRIIKPFFSD